ncbi:MAG: GTP-binding protein [Clostridia bacterium]|nr:GTP-binding protein [Clostridia bacterium]
MTKIDIFSGFLGAGKTTLIKKLIKEAYAGEKVVLIENEFGEIGIDGGFLQEAGINITEMNSGCICCSLVGDFSEALKKVAAQYVPDRIVIEPSGVGKLSDVIKAVASAGLENAKLNAFCTVVDASKCKMYMKNFGEFFNDQVENASCIILSHTDKTSEEKLSVAIALLKEKNADAVLVTAPWDQLCGKEILAAMKQENSLQAELEKLAHEVHHGHEHGHHHHHDDECDDPYCCCHRHHEPGHGHHHHHADEVFTSWGVETARKFSEADLSFALSELQNEEKYGVVLRAKGIVAGEGVWYHFDYVPEEPDLRTGAASVTGRLCVIGCNLKEDALKALFKV